MSCVCDMNGRSGNHCRTCCLTFSTVANFDRHIVRGEHVPPDVRGMVEVRPGVWGQRGAETRWHG